MANGGRIKGPTGATAPAGKKKKKKKKKKLVMHFSLGYHIFLT
jgi:hypothetical protein